MFGAWQCSEWHAKPWLYDISEEGVQAKERKSSEEKKEAIPGKRVPSFFFQNLIDRYPREKIKKIQGFFQSKRHII